jgi:predicted nucleic acid-binding protein
LTGWVIDSSFALAWVLPLESSAETERFLKKIGPETPLWVPALWWYEIANALLTAERRGRISESDSLGALELYRSMRLSTDSAGGPETLWRFRSLGREHGLSAYDAAYLELAARRQLPLASFDKALVQAARKAGVRTTAG